VKTMPSLTLRALVSKKSGNAPTVNAFVEMAKAAGSELYLAGPDGTALLGELPEGASSFSARVPIVVGDETLGYACGHSLQANALALLLAHLGGRETESRALAAEVLHLYREVHLIEQLSEQLAALLNVPAVCESALAQAQRLIAARHGCILVVDRIDGLLRSAASFGNSEGDSTIADGPLKPDSLFAASMLQRGIAEIVNDCALDSRAVGTEVDLGSLIYAPLRAGQQTVGIIALADSAPGTSYSAADLKLLNTIALQTAAAIENAILCEDMVGAARDREQLAAIQHEREAARTVQQVLIPDKLPMTPGFEIASVYRPFGEVGGDFFQIIPNEDGGILVAIGDVSGKGMPAAMTVSLLVGTLRTLAHYTQSPGEILAAMNHRMLDRSSGGFTTCLILRVDTDGSMTAANAGHIAPYLNGSEVTLENGLPLGLAADTAYAESRLTLTTGPQLTLVTDGVVEARRESGELFGFERTAQIADSTAEGIAQAAVAFGQDDDITVLTIARSV
jgi:Stage II sporulation protein E (SpoIIE)/GAF domain